MKALGETRWIEARAALTPRAEALRTRHESVPFGELAARARRTAGLLRAHGVRRGDVVAVLLPSDATAVPDGSCPMRRAPSGHSRRVEAWTFDSYPRTRSARR